MARFHAVSADAIEAFLNRAGFERTVVYHEVVYVRASQRDPNVWIKVYTSIRDGATLVRSKGSDAMRVCVVYDDGKKSFGVGRFPKVLRTTSDEAVIERLRQRLFQARARAIVFMDTQQVQRTNSYNEFDDETETEFD